MLRPPWTEVDAHFQKYAHCKPHAKPSAMPDACLAPPSPPAASALSAMPWTFCLEAVPAPSRGGVCLLPLFLTSMPMRVILISSCYLSVIFNIKCFFVPVFSRFPFFSLFFLFFSFSCSHWRLATFGSSPASRALLSRPSSRLPLSSPTSHLPTLVYPLSSPLSHLSSISS